MNHASKGWKTKPEEPGPFEVDQESGNANGRLDFEFPGVTQHPLSVDPSEFRGQALPLVTEAIMKMMAEIAPGVDFDKRDMVLAAEAVAEANGDPIP